MKKFFKSMLAVFIFCFAFFPVFANAADDEVTTVILVRHGETDYNAQKIFQGEADIPLNEKGLKQADLLAESLKDTKIDVFISSPMQRAYTMTKKVADLQGKEIAYADYRLKEASYGDWTGKFKAEIKEKFPKEYKAFDNQRWKNTPPNGESLKNLQKRYRAALDDAVKKYPGKTIFIGAHSKGNIVLICDILNIGIEHFNDLEQDNTCINVLKYKNGKWKVLLLNSTEHLGYLYKGEKKI